MAENFNRHHGAKERSFQTGDAVYFKRFHNNEWTWQPGKIVKRLGAANYDVDNGLRITKLHANQLQLRFSAPNVADLEDDELFTSFFNPQHIPNDDRDGSNQDDDDSPDSSQHDEDSGDTSAHDDFDSAEDESDDTEESDHESDQEPEPVQQPAYSRPQRSTAGKMPDRCKDFIVGCVITYLSK